jgi:hypothetical protein
MVSRLSRGMVLLVVAFSNGCLDTSPGAFDRQFDGSARPEASLPPDAGLDGGVEAGVEAGNEAANDATPDAGPDASPDADAGDMDVEGGLWDADAGDMEVGPPEPAIRHLRAVGGAGASSGPDIRIHLVIGRTRALK